MFWLTLLLFVGFTILGELLRPKSKFGAPQPSSLGDFVLPTAEEGRAIPVVFGTAYIKGPNVVWYGDLEARANEKKVKTGLFSSQKVTTSYTYAMGQQLVLCHGPVDALLDIRFDERSIPSSSVVIRSTGLRRNDGIRIGNGVSNATVLIAPGAYTDLGVLASAAQTALYTAGFAGGWRCVYGFQVVPGVTDQFEYSVRITGGAATNTVATIATGKYENGSDYAAAVAAAINANEALQGGGARIRVAGSFDGQYVTLVADLIRTGFDAWIIRGTPTAGYNVAALPQLGIQMGVDQTITTFPAVCTSDYAVGPRRFAFAYSGLAGALRLSSGEFSSYDVFGLTFGTDRTIKAYAGDAERSLPGLLLIDSTDKTTAYIDAPGLFGGPDREGGIVGVVDFYKGTQTQTSNAYLQAVLAATLPAYLGICYAVLRDIANRGMVLGNSPYLKPISFVVRRCPNGLGLVGGIENIGGDANPACMLYEIITNATWGLGLSASMVDTQSFTQAAQALGSESLGLSMVFDSQASAQDLINEILRHIDGVLYLDPRTAVIRIRLARGDYSVNDLPILDTSSISSCRMVRPSWDETKNVVKISYVDRLNGFTDRVAQAQDRANFEARGGEMSEESYSFRGLSNAAAAQTVAARVLKTVSYPIAAFELEVNRLAWWMRPGDVFRLDWPPLGISRMACRVTRIANGEIRDGRMKLQVVEDIFSVSWTAYAAIGASAWVDPIQAVQDFVAETLLEVPYALAGGNYRMVLPLVAKGSGGAPEGMQIWSAEGSQDYAHTNDSRVLSPSGPLGFALGYTDATVILAASGTDLGRLTSCSAAELAAGRNLALVDAELIAWRYINKNADGTFSLSGVVRGVADTVPALHALGAQAYFLLDGLQPLQLDPYVADSTIHAKLLPFNAAGALALADAGDLSLALNSRASRPYAPTAVTANGSAYPTLISGALALAWSHRNRLAAWSYANAGALGSAEASTTYTIRLYGEDGTLKKTFSSLAGTSQTWTNEQADSGLPVGVLNSTVRIELEAVIGGLVSFQFASFSVYRQNVTGATEGAGLLEAAVRGGRRPKRKAQVVSG